MKRRLGIAPACLVALWIGLAPQWLPGAPNDRASDRAGERPSAASTAAAPTILVPPVGEKAYALAGEAFAELWEKTTGRRPAIQRAAPGATPPAGDTIVLGSDAVQPLVHQWIREGVFENLKIRYGSDDYRILSLQRDGRRYLLLAGGCGRSTLYAVYDFFRRRAGVEYFWDGDVVPHCDAIDIAGLDVAERPRFEYRGQRYFAHRGLHRFQAEHWDLDDWKREIDWLVKKRFNLFMLRIGIDDLFQRAFPGEVAYPPVDGRDPDAALRSYDDRTSFWPLKYRGELRKQVLQYARDRGLIHPEDTGTITHWYSHTPSSFYKSRPDFPVVRDQATGYHLPTHAIWDIESQTTWEAYWQLTQTHIREFGEPRMFHTIGMAERTFGKSARDNLERKLYVYRKTQQKLREHYPDAPLLVASWDLWGWWKSPDVQRLLGEFDPQRTILLDYTADSPGRRTYRDWDVLNKFPWIFGIFHSFAKNSDIHEDYALLAPRLQEAADDAKCLGLVAWTEISHNDTFLLEYLADNSWNPQRLKAAEAASHYCKIRYPRELAGPMESLWTEFLPTAQSQHWNQPIGEEMQFRVLTSGQLVSAPQAAVDAYRSQCRGLQPGLKQATAAIRGLAGLTERGYELPLWRRDAIDIARTTANRALYAALTAAIVERETWRLKKTDAAKTKRLAQLHQDILGTLSELLAQSDDFSMDASLRRLEKARELGGVRPNVNPHAEQTLKGNAENDYCRSHHYELVEHVYRAESAVYWKWLLQRMESDERADRQRPKEFQVQRKAIVDRFYATPLATMAPKTPRNAKQLAESLNRLATLTGELAELIGS